MATSSSCPKCGTFGKSGAMSCCGRGGSWFGNCASAGHTKVHHTWQEGIRACKDRQFQSVVDHPIYASQTKRNASSGNARMDIDLRSVVMTVHKVTYAVPKKPTSVPKVTSVSVPVMASIIVPSAKFEVYNSNTTTPKIITKAISTTRHTPANMSKPKPIIPLVKETIISSTNVTITKWMRKTWAELSITTASHTPVSASITALECGKLLHVAINICLIIIVTVCWC